MAAEEFPRVAALAPPYADAAVARLVGAPVRNSEDHVVKAGRVICLRAERDGPDRRNLSAYLDTEGNLHIDGQDIGPRTAPVSADGEYEWFETVRATYVPQLVELLGGEAGDDVLDLLELRYRDAGSYDLEDLLSDDDIPVERFVYGG